MDTPQFLVERQNLIVRSLSHWLTLGVSHLPQDMGPLWLQGPPPGAFPLSLPAELPQLRGHCHLWTGAEVGSGRMGRAPHGGAGAQRHIPGARPPSEGRHFWAGQQRSLQDTVAAQGRAVCLAGSCFQLPQSRPHSPRQGSLQLLFSQPWLRQGLGGWGWFQLDHLWHNPQRDPGRSLASWWLPRSTPGGRTGNHQTCLQASLEVEQGPSPMKLEVLGSEE